MQNDSSEEENSTHKEEIKKKATFISWYTVIVTFICLFIFGYILSDGKPFNLFDESSNNIQSGEKQKQDPSVENQQKNENQTLHSKAVSDGFHRLGIFLLVLSSGAIGGCLYNFRGIKKHLEKENFKSKYLLSYLLRPLSAALSGLFIFALALSGVFVLTVGEANLHAHEVSSIMIFVSLSLLAGYGSHEFLKKVKDIMKTLFALSELERIDDKKGPRPSDR